MTAIDQFVEKVLRAKHDYCGYLDEKGFRNGLGCENWHKDNIIQKYSGHFLNNNLHSNGVFLIDKNGDQTYMDGSFFANKLEGYGRVIYADNIIFEGLFKQQTRFGPGAVTHPDGSQDVGIWEGFSLRRLSVGIGDDFVPRLGKTSFGKARLIPFRAMVPICIKPPDAAKEVLTELNASEEVLAQSDDLYNLHVRNPHSLFFNNVMYNKNFFTEQECTIDVLISQEEYEEEMFNFNFSHDLMIELQSENIIRPKPECSCFLPNIDRFGQMCLQLQEVEMKLEKLTKKKLRVNEKLQKCKYCCDHIIVIKSKPEAPTKPEVSAEECKETTVQHSVEKNVSHKKVLSFYSSCSAGSEGSACHLGTRSEIEIKNYLYTNDSFVTAEGQHQEEGFYYDKSSGLTLPFGHWDSATSGMVASGGRLQHFDEPTMYFEQAEEENDFVHKLTPLYECYCTQKLIENIDILRKQLKSLTQEELFYTTIRNCIKDHLDIEYNLLHHQENERTRFVKKVIVTDLLAWNNEKIWIEMLQHCFRHKTSENNVRFNVSDVLTGQRQYFQKVGDYENNCKNFLKECSEGHEKNVFSYIRNSNINPDLCDCRGNTGIMLATLRDKINCISILVNCGAKIDIMNDEGLTPLTISLLQYISFKFKVTDWERAFLNSKTLLGDEFATVQQWRPTESLIRFCENSSVDPLTTEELNKQYETCDKPLINCLYEDKEQKYIFNTDYIRITSKNTSDKGHKKNKKKKKNKKEKNKEKNRDEHEKKDTSDSDECGRKLEIIKHTILTLIHYGSDPCIGDVPLKAIFLSVFTDDSELLGGLLKNNADPNAVTTEENLTSLHLIVSLRPSLEKVKMTRILLNHHADPNIRTSSKHWCELKDELIGKDHDDVEICQEGKNVLHVLCLREDFSCDLENYLPTIADMLVANGCRTGDYYMGHTPLSLAVFKGNRSLIETLLKTMKVDPYQFLGNKMGNALTVLVLNRFQSILTNEEKKEVADCLIKNGLNPLHKIGKFENVVLFMENEHNLLQAKKVPSTKKQKKKKKNTSKRSLKSSSKSGSKLWKTSSAKLSKQKINATKSESVENFIIAAARNILYRHLQGTAVNCLYTLIKETLVADPLAIVLAKFVALEEIVNIIQLLFQHAVIDFKKFSYEVINDLVEFVYIQQHFNEEQSTEEHNKVKEKIKTIQWKPFKRFSQNIYLPPPEVDLDEDKYRICFQCLKGKGKRLIRCPSCELVYFCSEHCNILNNKTSKYHTCKVTFYKEISEIIKDEPQPSRINVLLKMASKLSSERIALSQLMEMQAKIENLKFVPKTTKHKFDILYYEFKKTEKEREDFAIKNSLWDYANIVMQDRPQYVYYEKIPEITASRIFRSYSRAFSVASGLSADADKIMGYRSQNLLYNTPQALSPTSTTAVFTPRPRGLSQIFDRKKSSIFLKIDKNEDTYKRFEEKRKSQNLALEKNEDKDKNYYMQLLSKIFAGFNLPLLLLPYACYKDGQVYYSMTGNMSYFGSSFHKLQIPD